MYLVGDPASKVLDGELWEGHLWLDVQWTVAVVIVTLLEERVVCCLTTKQRMVSQWISERGRERGASPIRPDPPTCGKQLWSSRILSIPWGFAAMRSMQGWLSRNGMSCQGICSLLYSSYTRQLQSSCGLNCWSHHEVCVILFALSCVCVRVLNSVQLTCSSLNMIRLKKNCRYSFA